MMGLKNSQTKNTQKWRLSLSLNSWVVHFLGRNPGLPSGKSKAGLPVPRPPSCRNTQFKYITKYSYSSLKGIFTDIFIKNVCIYKAKSELHIPINWLLLFDIQAIMVSWSTHKMLIQSNDSYIYYLNARFINEIVRYVFCTKIRAI